MIVAIAPIAVRYRRPPDRDPDRGRRRRRPTSPPQAVGIADTLLNVPPAGADPATWKKPFAIERRRRRRGRRAELDRGALGGVMLVERLANGQVDVALRTIEGPNSAAQPDPERRGVRDRRPRLERPAAAGRAARRSSMPPAYRVDSRSTPPTDGGQAARCAAGRQPRLPRDRVRRPAVHHDRHLRHVGRDRRRRREEQPGDGADDQRRLAAPDADRQGRRDRRGRADPVPRDRRARRSSLLAFQDRIAAAVLGPDWAAGAPLGRADARRCCWATGCSSCSGSRCSP